MGRTGWIQTCVSRKSLLTSSTFTTVWFSSSNEPGFRPFLNPFKKNSHLKRFWWKLREIKNWFCIVDDRSRSQKVFFCFLLFFRDETDHSWANQGLFPSPKPACCSLPVKPTGRRASTRPGPGVRARGSAAIWAEPACVSSLRSYATG